MTSVAHLSPRLLQDFDDLFRRVLLGEVKKLVLQKGQA
jgi:hypothetical protein